MVKRINKKQLVDIALGCYRKFKVSGNKVEALKNISNEATGKIGFNLNRFVLDSFDDIAIGFIELLEQIMFEIENELKQNGDGIGEYLIDDLYQRADCYLDLFKDIEIYKKNLRERVINHDDPLIIRYYGLTEFIPTLEFEFFEQPNMRHAILTALLFFNEHELLHFFYKIVKNDYEAELKILALIGLKKFKYRFDNWHLLKDGNADYSNLIDYVKTFNYSDSKESNHYGNIYIMLFKILYVEISLMNKQDFPDMAGLLHFLNETTSYTIDNSSIQQQLNNSIANIISRLDFNVLSSVLEDSENLKSFLHLINALPVESFDRIIVIIDLLGEDFLIKVERLIESGDYKLDEKNSNLMSYLFSVGLDLVNF